MQKLKLYVIETKCKRRELTREENLIRKVYYRNTDHKMGLLDYLNDIGYCGEYASDEGEYGSAEFEITSEREATDNEYNAWFTLEKQKHGTVYPSCIKNISNDILHGKEFRVEVVEE